MSDYDDNMQDDYDSYMNIGELSDNFGCDDDEDTPKNINDARPQNKEIGCLSIILIICLLALSSRT